MNLVGEGKPAFLQGAELTLELRAAHSVQESLSLPQGLVHSSLVSIEAAPDSLSD